MSYTKGKAVVNTMQAITTYASAFLETMERRIKRPESQAAMKSLAAGGAGFLLSAASIANQAVPLALGLLCAAPAGVCAAAVAIGGCIGYLLFWKEAQAIAWMAAGLLAVAIAGDTVVARQQKLLLPALAAVVVSGCGLGFLLLFGDDTPVRLYLLRVVVSFAATACFRAWRAEPKGTAGWLVCGMVTLSCAQIAPGPYWNLGYLAAGFICVRLPLPMVAMAGLGLDLAQVTKIPMTGVMCLGFLLRLIPNPPKCFPALAPFLTYCAVSLASSQLDWFPLPGLILGGIAGHLLPGNPLGPGILTRKGPTGIAQVRLEQASIAMVHLEHALMLTRDPEIDLRSLLRRAASDSCDTCPERKGCKARGKITALAPEILEQPGLDTGDLPAGCKKTVRLLNNLRREQERLRSIKASRSQQRTYRTALADQYRFLSGYLQELSDGLCTIHDRKIPRFRPEIGVSARSLEETIGDRWLHITPREETSYFLLCDGMGTGEGAARDAADALDLLKQMLEAGFPPEQALRSFNSLSVLRSSGGSATVDLVKMDLCSGKVSLYKWGACASYLLSAGQLQKIGTAGPPPGLSQQARESENRLSLGGEDMLILLSDGAGAEGLARSECSADNLAAGEIAASILANGVQRGDDATVAVIRLIPLRTNTP